MLHCEQVPAVAEKLEKYNQYYQPAEEKLLIKLGLFNWEKTVKEGCNRASLKWMMAKTFTGKEEAACKQII